MQRRRVAERITRTALGKELFGDDVAQVQSSYIWDGTATLEELLDPIFRAKHDIFFDEEADASFRLFYHVEVYDPVTDEWIQERLLHFTAEAVA